MIQLAALSAFMNRGRWFAFCRIVSASTGVILVAISSAPLSVWLYAFAGAVTLAWLAVEAFSKTIHRRSRLALRYATLSVGCLGIALELPYHLMPTIPRLQNAQVFLVGDSLTQESIAKPKPGPSCSAARIKSPFTTCPSQAPMSRQRRSRPSK